MHNYAIILASGLGSRFGGNTPKQFLKIGNKTILEMSVEAFEINTNIDNIIVVIHPDYEEQTKNLLKNYTKVSKIVYGGNTRKESSYNGVCAIEEHEANVLIHDCARPFVSQKIINDCAQALKDNDAVTVAVPVTDTIIETDGKILNKVLNRSVLYKNQTPQCFRLSLIKKGHELHAQGTDDCSLVVDLTQIHIIDGDEKNIKITYKSDVLI